MGLKFFGNEVTAKIHKCMEDNLDLAGISTAETVKQLIGRNQPRKGKGARKRGTNPSKPGEPPKRVTSQLQKSYIWEQNRPLLIGRVSTPLKKALFLELGTSRMRKRPHLVNAFFINKTRIVRALSRPCPGGL